MSYKCWVFFRHLDWQQLVDILVCWLRLAVYPVVMASGRKDRQKDRDRERERALLERYGERSFPPPCPGDTLPWNLDKHQRVKRSKSASGSGDVLDPAERAVIRIAGEFFFRCLTHQQEG
eukprot:XP_014055801.1 PREDICTED: microtubule-actin cross-linking factor 1-like [Salmo salar]